MQLQTHDFPNKKEECAQEKTLSFTSKNAFATIVLL